MRSIAYLALGIPSNIDDCLDLAEREPPLNVSYELKTNLLLAEWFLMTTHTAVFTWQFASRPKAVVVEHILAAYPQGSGAEARSRHLTEANFRIDRILARLKAFAIPVTSHARSSGSTRTAPEGFIPSYSPTGTPPAGNRRRKQSSRPHVSVSASSQGPAVADTVLAPCP